MATVVADIAVVVAVVVARLAVVFGLLLVAGHWQLDVGLGDGQQPMQLRRPNEGADDGTEDVGVDDWLQTVHDEMSAGAAGEDGELHGGPEDGGFV